MTTNTDVAMPELPKPNICEVTMGDHRGTLSYYTAQDLLDYAKAKQSQRERVYESLLKQCVGQLKAWHSKYGENGPSWLPPGGDVRLMETIDDWLNSAPEYPIPLPRSAIQQAAGAVPEGPFAWYSAKVDDVITDAKKQGRLLVQPWDAKHYDKPLYAASTAPPKQQLEDPLSMSMFASRADFEAESLARRFHEAYERLAPSFGYATRTDTREFYPTTDNGQLMTAVCREILAASGQVHLGGGEGGWVPQWQPIETAPKWPPGTEREFVLLWCPNAYNVEHIKVGYVEATGAVYSMYEATGEMGSEPQRDATHWMRRPTTPEAK